MPGFEPQTDVQIITIPCDAALETTPTIGELCLLGVPDEVRVVELLPLGYPADPGPKEKSRKPLDDIVHWDRW